TSFPRDWVSAVCSSDLGKPDAAEKTLRDFTAAGIKQEKTMTDLIKTAKKDGILTITMNRPDKKNALTTGMYSDMAKAIKDAESDSDLRVILITGSRDAFCAGNDLGDFLSNPPQDDSSPVLQFLKTLSEAKLPVVA